MKFKVRDGFHVHHERTLQTKKGAEKITTHYPENQEIELEEEDARLHAHRIEGADEASVKFLESLVTPVSGPALPTAEQLAAALAALGMTAVPAARVGRQA